MTADHDRMEELVASYALGACDGEDRQRVERHLAGCPECRALAGRFGRTVAALPLALDPERPPDRLRARILAAAAAGRAPARVVPLPVRPEARRRRFRLQWAAVAVLVGALAGLGAWNVVLDRSLNAPPARYQMVGTGALAGASGTVTEFRGQDAALVALTGMPAPEPGKVYQLWLIDGSNRTTSAGTFTPSADGTARVGVDHRLAGVRTIAVTEETGPAGAQAPTGKPELAGQLGS
jgi:anti-sigma-K factor RskA